MDPLHLVAAVIVGTVAVARAVRLVTSDAYPPARGLRDWWLRKTGVPTVMPDQSVRMDDGPWTPLLECPFCFAPYATLVNLAWAVAVLPGSDPLDYWSAGWWWWVVNLWAAVSYVAAMTVARDEPPAE